MDSIGNIINRINLILGALFDVAGIGGGGGGRRFGGKRSENRMGGENQGSLKQLQQAEVEKLSLEMACYDGMGTTMY